MIKYNTKNGKEIIIRRPVEEDAERIIKYAKELFTSTDQLLTTLIEYCITVEDEKIWIKNSYQSQNTLILVAEHDAKIVGLLDFSSKTKVKNAHTGEFGVSVHADFQGVGIGSLLVETLLQWAWKNPQLEKVFLNVFHTNQQAINLYKKLGFQEEGRHINAAKQPSGEYVDIIQMYIETK